MKKFVFVSDFDGTITKRDFYWVMIDKYMKELGNEKYEEWKSGKLKDIDFLGSIFKNINREEEDIKKDILELEIDPFLHQFIQFIHSTGGDFVILSAGATYYIEVILEHFELDDIKVYSNRAIYKDKGIHYDIDPTHRYYSERYGIDKKKVVEDLKNEYDKVYYAGDSMPDYVPSMISDVRFATGKLIDIFKEKNVVFYEFESFRDIKRIMEEKEVE